MGPYVFVCDGAHLHKRRFHLEEFLTFACSFGICRHQRTNQNWKETASSTHDAISFSSHLSPTAWSDCYFVSGICDCPLGSGFCSSGLYSHSPFDSSRSPDFIHVQDQENYPVAGILRVPSVGDLLGMGFPGVDRILPCPTVALTNTQVLPTDGTNCRDWIWTLCLKGKWI